MIDPKSGLLGCFEGTSGLFRFTVDESQSESFVLEQIWRGTKKHNKIHISSIFSISNLNQSLEPL